MNAYRPSPDSDQENSQPRRSDTKSSLGQLRQNLRDARLREVMHRPYYPSPLSQSPVQASISSASHTAASIASTSRSTVTTSTTPPSTSSRFSITQAFKTLSDDDIDFFDRLISTLPSYAADFSQLKSAYTAHLPDELERRHRRAGSSRHDDQFDWDAHLWSILLSLVKVRGNNWRERWDTVRVALGLDPNSGDETDPSTATRSTGRGATDSSSQHNADQRSDRELNEPYHRHVRGTRDWGNAAHASTPPQERSRNSVLPSRYDLGLPRSSSPAPSYDPPERSYPQPRSLHDELELERTPRSRPSPSHDPISEIQARLSRMLDSEEDERPNKSRTLGAVPSNETAAELQVPSSDDAVRLPADARRRFDELVRSSQSARSRLRQSQATTHEQDEQLALTQQDEIADLWRARRLLQTCLAWWITLTRQQLDKYQNAADASARVLVGKAWERWRSQGQSAQQGNHIGEKTDRVRCTLTAFRRWKRLAHTAKERKDELKKDTMRTAYYTTTTAVKTRLVREAFAVWKYRHLHRLADKVRRRHLQSGAFALWQMRSSHTKQLQTREKILKDKHHGSVLSQAWERWVDRSEKAKGLRQFQHHHNRLLLLEALHTWRERTMLSGLSHAFAERRLKLAALDRWKDAVEQQRTRRKQEALANRWRARRLKEGALIAWKQQSHKILAMQERAVDLHDNIQQHKLLSVFHRWQLRSRAALLERVRTTHTLEQAFYHWKHRHAELTTSLQQRESTIVDRRHQVVKAACFHKWRHLAAHILDREADVVAQRDETICNDSFVAWRNKLLHHRLLKQKSAAVSDYFTLRSSLKQWRDKLREHQAEVKVAQHDRRLVQQVFEIWRSKAAKQQHLAQLLQHSLARSDESLARAYLNQWVAKTVEIRDRELKVKLQRQRRLLKAAFCAWIEACLRHDDLLALMNSFIDVKEEDRKKQTFLHWLNFAREQKERREKAEMLEASTQKKLLSTTWNAWRDKQKELGLATLEYEMLMRRHQLSQRWVLNTWMSQTPLLPAIRMRNTSLKRSAFQQWRQHLPSAQMINQAKKIARTRLLQGSWQVWADNWKAKRQFRAAARFGAGTVSSQRLRTLSAAASAAKRSAGSSSPSVAHSSSPFRALAAAHSSSHSATPVQRPRTSLAIQSPTPKNGSELEEGEVRSGRSAQRESSFSRRARSVPRHMDTSFASDSMHTPTFSRQPQRDTLYSDAESPSREAASRRARVAESAATPTSTNVSEQSRFSLALKSSTSSISASHAPLDELDSATISRRHLHKLDDGPTLSSAAQRSTMNGREQSDTESHFARRVKRSAKYAQTPLAGPKLERSRTVGQRPPASDDGPESASSIRSAPAPSAAIEPLRMPRRSFVVAEDMISQLRARAETRQRRQR